MSERVPVSLRRVLIIKMWALGDILMATPMLNALHAAHPGVQVTWIADSAHADLLRGHPLIHELIALDSGAWRRLLRRGNLPGWVVRTRQLHAEMRHRRFDAVINCQPDKWWTVFLCAAPRRIGLYPSPTLPRTRHAYTTALARPPSVHNTDNFLMATQALGCPDAGHHMTLGETPDGADFWPQFRDRHSLEDGRPVVILAPFSTGANRCWEPERHAQVADWLRVTYGATLIMTAGPKDVEDARHITSLARAPIIVAEGTTLTQYIALLRRADVVVCSDSSPMHIAAAVGTPYVALFGPTPVRERAPLAGRGLALAKPLPCAPCDSASCTHPTFRQCMKLIEPLDVQDALTALLKETKYAHEPSPAR